MSICKLKRKNEDTYTKREAAKFQGSVFTQKKTTHRVLKLAKLTTEKISNKKQQAIIFGRLCILSHVFNVNWSKTGKKKCI